MIRRAMQALHEPIGSLGGRMLLQVHDSLLFLLREDRLAESLATIRHHMEAFPEWDIPARVDIKVGPNWLDVKEAA